MDDIKTEVTEGEPKKKARGFAEIVEPETGLTYKEIYKSTGFYHDMSGKNKKPKERGVKRRCTCCGREFEEVPFTVNAFSWTRVYLDTEEHINRNWICENCKKEISLFMTRVLRDRNDWSVVEVSNHEKGRYHKSKLVDGLGGKKK